MMTVLHIAKKIKLKWIKQNLSFLFFFWYQDECSCKIYGAQIHSKGHGPSFILKFAIWLRGWPVKQQKALHCSLYPEVKLVQMTKAVKVQKNWRLQRTGKVREEFREKGRFTGPWELDRRRTFQLRRMRALWEKDKCWVAGVLCMSTLKHLGFSHRKLSEVFTRQASQ